VDLVTGNLYSTNRIYLNDGHGGFGRALDQPPHRATTAIAVGDVDRVHGLDVVAGDSKAAIGAAGAISAVDAGGQVQAFVASDATVLTDRSLFVTANDDADIVTLAGADAYGNIPAVGVPRDTNVQRHVAAHIDGDVSVDGAQA